MPQTFKTGDVVQIRASQYRLTHVAVGHRSSKGVMISGRGKIGAEYKIHPSLMPSATLVRQADGTPISHFAPTQPAGPTQPADIINAQAKIAAWNPYKMSTWCNMCMMEFGSTLRHGDKFTYNGKQWSLEGYDPRKPTYPVLATNSNGTCYKLPVRAVLPR